MADISNISEKREDDSKNGDVAARPAGWCAAFIPFVVVPWREWQPPLATQQIDAEVRLGEVHRWWGRSTDLREDTGLEVHAFEALNGLHRHLHSYNGGGSRRCGGEIKGGEEPEQRDLFCTH